MIKFLKKLESEKKFTMAIIETTATEDSSGESSSSSSDSDDNQGELHGMLQELIDNNNNTSSNQSSVRGRNKSADPSLSRTLSEGGDRF